MLSVGVEYHRRMPLQVTENHPQTPKRRKKSTLPHTSLEIVYLIQISSQEEFVHKDTFELEIIFSYTFYYKS